MRRMPGRPTRRDADTRDDAPRSGVIPVGALTMLLAMSGVFAYGIYLKAAGPSAPADAPAGHTAPATPPPSPGGVRPSASPSGATPDAGIPTQTASDASPSPGSLGPDAIDGAPVLAPVIPEATTASTLPGGLGAGSAASPAPRPSPPPVSPAPRPSAPPASSAPRSSSPPVSSAPRPIAPSVSSAPPTCPAAEPVTPPRSAARTPEPRPSLSVKARHDEPAAPSRDSVASAVKAAEAKAAEARSDATSPSQAQDRASRLTVAPRGAAPAVALKNAREQFVAKKYKDAARSWNDWAQRAPSGSWTVQIAAIRLDKAASAAKLEGIAGRDGAFVLPGGTLPGGLSPVCIGVYPSEEAARRAAASLAPFPGSSNRPIAKPLSSLSR